MKIKYILTSLTSSLSLPNSGTVPAASSLLAKTIVIRDLLVQSKAHYWLEMSTLFIHVGDNVELIIWNIGAAGDEEEEEEATEEFASEDNLFEDN